MTEEQPFIGPKAQTLIDKYGWHQGLAKAMEDSNGYCRYCNKNLLVNRIAYFSITLDHLLPKSKYPEIEANLENHVLSCNACNFIKKDFDPLDAGENPLHMLRDCHEVLIRRVKILIKTKSEERNNELDEIRRLMGS